MPANPVAAAATAATSSALGELPGDGEGERCANKFAIEKNRGRPARTCFMSMCLRISPIRCQRNKLPEKNRRRFCKRHRGGCDVKKARRNLSQSETSTLRARHYRQ